MRYLFDQKSPLTLFNDHILWDRCHAGAMAVNTRDTVPFLMELIVNKIHQIKQLLCDSTLCVCVCVLLKLKLHSRTPSASYMGDAFCNIDWYSRHCNTSAKIHFFRDNR